MAHLWFPNNADGWGLHPLSDVPCSLAGSPDGPVFTTPPASPLASDQVLLQPRPAGPTGPAAWLLLAGPSAQVRVNGADLPLGLRILRDQDDVTVAGRRLFFSSEQLAVVAPFVGLDQPAFCPRCKQPLQAGEAAVPCPRCRAWHHQTETFPCWTYDEHCALCHQQATALDAGYAWMPDQL